MFRSFLAMLTLAGVVQAAWAQKPQTFGTVSGFVFCSDTNTPARLAYVVLRPLPSVKGKNAAPAVSEAVETRLVQTSLDGSFSIPQVAPGRYYILALAEGYVSPLAALGISDSDLLSPDEATRTKLLAQVPTLVVEANVGGSVNLSLERGAAVAGTILFDDGSPAAGVGVHLLTHKQGKWVPIQTGTADGLAVNSVSTDDRGHYRISGIPPEEECLVKVELTLSSSRNFHSKNGQAFYNLGSYSLEVYSGGALRPSSAKPFALKLGEERPGEDVVLPVSKLHKVQGVVTMQRDGHVLNRLRYHLSSRTTSQWQERRRLPRARPVSRFRLWRREITFCASRARPMCGSKTYRTDRAACRLPILKPTYCTAMVQQKCPSMWTETCLI